MNLKGESVIGIVGGMGPEAGINLLNHITRCTQASRDQDHLSTILMSFARHIPDRTSFLEGDIVDNPGFIIADIIRKLESSGADIVGIACNTAHCSKIFNVIQQELSIHKSGVKLLNMPLETCQYLKSTHPSARRSGVLTTNGTYKSGLYHKLLHQMGLEVVVPDATFQQQIIHKMIYDAEFGIKSKPGKISAEVKSLLYQTIALFKEKNADAIILGCTELSLAFEDLIEDFLIIDSAKILAHALVKASSEKLLC